MRYAIKHVTRFGYDSAITESVMEARMQPRSDGLQRCLRFGLSTVPASRILMYQDHDGNIVHHFNIPGRHARLSLTAEALVDCEAPPPVPERLDGNAWTQLDAIAAAGECWEFLAPSAFARPTPLLQALAGELQVARAADPVSLLRRVAAEMYARLEYAPQATRVDSPIDDALSARLGVCQDFAHVFIALARSVGVPARYVSGYLFHSLDAAHRSSDGATHAWAEVLLPGFGWIGIDPTNNVFTTERHVRVAIGRDYADVPPTRGVYKGTTAVRSELAVSVRVAPVRGDITTEPLPFAPWLSQDASPPPPDTTLQHAMQQQQQQ
jgi:transglutaminase-like putative cysteine protease